MPTYEYVCTECGAPLEVVQSIHEPSLTECPACHGRLRKVFGNVGVVFKGSGFYRTDSRSKSTAGAGGSSEKAPAAKTAAAASAKSDTSATSKPTTGSSSAPAATPAPAKSA